MGQKQKKDEKIAGDFWRAIENTKASDKLQLSLIEVLGKLRFNQDGLLPVISQCIDTHRVLMMAWMNQESLLLTLAQGQMMYYSRSRQKLWRKGEQSGCWQKLCQLRIDCDGDTLLAIVRQQGGACHTNRLSCFYWQVLPPQEEQSGSVFLVSEQDQ